MVNRHQMWLAGSAAPLIHLQLPRILSHSVQEQEWFNRMQYAAYGLWPMLAFQSLALDRGRSSLPSQIWHSLGQRHIQWRISSVFDTLVTDWIEPRKKTHMKFVDRILFG
ncbi:hypothetical protein BT96DRAFT_493945 [Gymnopus androsaceus JB14]|uniref:Uncharacterized protein n=1 Tax=Gymnopus androsaceus JB14 TaxID=1447944 RepID=A0A6A4HXN3_9AGAR|nr:hypothetical protein BT96DRAFT_493945 [Gymnopus androsaceus JB14]